MTHPNPARRKDAIEARNYEVALSALVSEQKERTALSILSGDFDMMARELAICTKLEDHRRDLIEGTLDRTTSDAHMISVLVRGRIDKCSCQPATFRPGEYCAECGVYRPDGDEF